MALAARAARSFPAGDVIEVIADLMLAHGVPEHIRSDNGPEFTAKAIRQWLSANQVKTVYIKPGAPWENAFAESFISRVRDELLDREIFYTLEEARVMLERFRIDYNSVRPHSALGYLSPLEAIAGGGVMDQLPIAIRLLLAGLIDGPASVFVGATGGRNISFAASSPAGELAAPSHKTMSQTTWYQNRGPATISKQHSTSGNESRERRNGESIRQDRVPAGAIEIQLTGWFTLF